MDFMYYFFSKSIEGERLTLQLIKNENQHADI